MNNNWLSRSTAPEDNMVLPAWYATAVEATSYSIPVRPQTGIYMGIMYVYYIRFWLLYLKKKSIERSKGMPQSQTVANPRHQEEEKKGQLHAQNNQMYEKHTDQLPLPQARWVIRKLRQTEKRGQRAREDFKTLSAPWYKPQSYTELSKRRDHRLRTLSSINYRGGGGRGGIKYF